ncbi:MAG: 4Fe-4S dicluster domain-containing protein [Methanobacterium sp.]|uniref:4Fe-4S dicluster domain-containing protein n=1 Tax=Methanobacterium sp. TaxID=2164 RepID=UPI0025868AF8|nr:4Fe-4S dicluster domain-containing protein [Methanobacterium sp.]MCC7560704.1 4Fe-4S dicluster domain-containing protein [Methanobacterium sp.]
MTRRKKEPYPVFNELECKACERCILACRPSVLKMSEDINERGYHYAVYKGEGCTGCGDCYYTCPEPLAVEVHIPQKIRNKDPNKPINGEDQEENK